MSHTVSAGLHTLAALGKLPQAAKVTAEFVKTVNDIFDILNVRSSNSQSLSRKDFAKLAVYREKVALWNVNGRSQPCFEGLLLNLHATEHLAKSLFDAGHLNTLPTGKVSQDCLENFFSQVRVRGGHRTNPSTLEFSYTYRTLCTNLLLAPVHTGNCTYGGEDVLVSLTSLNKMARTRKRQAADNTTDEPPAKVLKLSGASSLVVESMEDFQVTSTVSNVVTYIGGYVLRKLKAKCQECISDLLYSTNVVQESQLFTHFKAYEHGDSAFGALLVPEHRVCQLLWRVERLFGQNIVRFTCTGHVLHNLLQVVQERIPATLNIKCSMHSSEDVLLSIAKAYLKCRIFYYCKFESRRISLEKIKSRKNKRNRKAKILCNE